jgi:hypothetical protein
MLSLCSGHFTLENPSTALGGSKASQPARTSSRATILPICYSTFSRRASQLFRRCIEMFVCTISVQMYFHQYYLPNMR